MFLSHLFLVALSKVICFLISIIMSAVQFLPKAIEHVKRAADEDKAGNYKEAFRLYQLSLEYFMTALKCIDLFPFVFALLLSSPKLPSTCFDFPKAVTLGFRALLSG